jgi:hypothetical protein
MSSLAPISQLNDDEDLSRPSVQVKLPQVRLTLEDLAYLRSLTQEKALRCHPNERILNRLRFLDLIARAHVQPTPETIEKANLERGRLLSELQALVASRAWEKLIMVAYALRALEQSLQPVEDTVLTSHGKKLLRDGEGIVRARKGGCV